MAKKKSVKKTKKKVSRSPTKKRAIKKLPQNQIPIQNIKKKWKKTTKSLLYSFVVFIISLVLYLVTSQEVLESVFGFVMIISGALVILFLIIELIFYFLKK